MKQDNRKKLPILQSGGYYNPRLVTYGDAPGYRSISVWLDVGGTEVELRFNEKDSERLLHHLLEVHQFAWRRPGNAPLDARPGEQRPAWLPN